MVRVRSLAPRRLVIITSLVHSALSAHGNATAWRLPRRTHLAAPRPAFALRRGRPHSQCDRLAPGSAVPTLTMRFPVPEYVASLAMVRVRSLVPPPLVVTLLLRSALSAHGNATALPFPREAPRRTHLLPRDRVSDARSAGASARRRPLAHNACSGDGVCRIARALRRAQGAPSLSRGDGSRPQPGPTTAQHAGGALRTTCGLVTSSRLNCLEQA